VVVKGVKFKQINKIIMEVVITFVALFATIFGMVYFYLITRNKERLALIQSGADASLFKAPSKYNYSWAFSIVLVLGLLAMGLGLGLFVGFLVDIIIDRSYSQVYIMSMFFFGGLSLVISFFVIRALYKKEEKELQAA
jgi:hypothetical protein